MVKPRGWRRQTPHSLGGEIQRHPCLWRPSELLTNIWRDYGKACSVCLLFGPRNLLARYTVKAEESLVGFVVSPIFMLEIWHGVDWLKEIFGSTQSMIRWYMEVPDLVGLYI